MQFDRAIRLGWLVLATAVLFIWCAFPRLRTIRVSVDSAVSVNGTLDTDFPSKLDLDVTHY